MDGDKLNELLIRMDQTLIDMAPRIGKIETALEKQRDVCSTRVDGCNRMFDQRVSSTMFRWVVGILITLMIGIGATSTATKLDVNDIKHQIETHVIDNSTR